MREKVQETRIAEIKLKELKRQLRQAKTEQKEQKPGLIEGPQVARVQGQPQ